MYEYKYVILQGKSGFALLRFEEHRTCIDRCAAQGWRYVGWVPVDITSGAMTRMDLVFEREI